MTVSSYPHRLRYLRDTLISWSNVRGLDNWYFRFHVEPDGARYDTVNIILDWIENNELSSAEIIYNDTRLGVLCNPWSAFDSAFWLGADFVVLTEEDILVCADVLEYMEKCNLEYKSNSKVLGVCGTCFHDTGDFDVTYLAEDFCPLVWGTWKNRWSSILRDTWDKDYSTGNPDGSEAGWDWNIRRRLLPQLGMTFVHPQVTRALHIGEYGVHMRPEDFRASQAPNFRLG